MYFSYLHPAISSVHVLMANLKLVSAFCNEVPYSSKELVVVRCAKKVAKGKEEVFNRQYFAMFFLISKFI